ncbi:MAG: hypothetical protein HOC71_11480 [Candidatus Latescibacteria bacterium]|nr:hypothetical protein [Candidatus Latescibacterota bacterium]
MAKAYRARIPQNYFHQRQELTEYLTGTGGSATYLSTFLAFLSLQIRETAGVCLKRKG